MNKQAHRSALLGAAFLMATSAIGPGFLTQTTVFTTQLGASFGFVILVSVLIDLCVQVNIWRIVTVSGQAAPRLANRMLPSLGHALTLMIVFGGLAFNIGNIAGAGLGLEVLAGIPASWGAMLSGLLALGIFWQKEAGNALDVFAKLLGFLMILLMAWVAVAAKPPLQEVVIRSIVPQQIDPRAILTIVGGTVGGYISFAGAHRLLEAGRRGAEQLPSVTKSAFTGIGVATLMRILLFLAAFGVVASGTSIDPSNPPASMFRAAAGEPGFRFFGLVMWAAAITSVVGCTFTSISFLSVSLPALEKNPRNKRWVIAGFIALSVLTFVLVGKPVKLLVWAGTVNGFILPIALATMLLAARKTDLMQGYRLPLGWQLAGWVAVAVMGGMTLW